MARIAVLFDVDGVLNCMHSKSELDDANLEILEQICRLGDSILVLASTWKELFREGMSKEGMQMADMLVRKLSDYGLHIQDMTPDAPLGRPAQCARWLSEHKDDYDAYLVLDDDFPKAEYGKYGIDIGLVQTQYFSASTEEGGLQEKHIGFAKQSIKHQLE